MGAKAEGQTPRLTNTDVKARAQELSALALATLAEIMGGEGQVSVKLAAAREVLDRAHGRPQAAKPTKRRAPKPTDPGLTVIVKHFSDVTPEEEAAAEATERGEL